MGKKPAAPKYDVMSVADLEERIAELQAEIETIRQVIAKKQAARGAAAGFFKQ
ncbi:DUF1192 family protein [Ferrovibrio sp.]|uniref:DUF1192 family protein n=1 Tax=Ferrovibrio sp. TaxID=1917215 RepID=UPI0025C70383|nr:DUF1192 family protein [Ferrovibrio sp.]